MTQRPIPNRDLSQNPYNYNAPIHEPTQLVGRQAQLADARYYLDDARTNHQPYSLALIGARASGKTSLLIALEHEALIRKFVTIRISLTSADGTGIAFFERLIAAVIRSVHRDPEERDVIVQFENIITGYVDPEAYPDFPYRFPRLAAKLGFHSNRAGIALQDDILLADLRALAQRAENPICILIDEGDVLALNRTALQSLRNLLSELTRYQIIISGTPALFDVVDVVFSPIVRQFKRIEVGAFADESDTRDCIRQPLTKLRSAEPGAYFNFENARSIGEIHNISGGRPYEVQLLSHFMFRQLQEAGGDERMHLSADVLDDVVRELGKGHSLAERPLFSVVRNYDTGTFRSLRTFLRGDGFCSIQQLEFVALLSTSTEATNLTEAYLRFNADGILRTVDGRINFAGDDLDRIYLRYYALRGGTAISERSEPFEALVTRQMAATMEAFNLRHLFTDRDIVADGSLRNALMAAFRDLLDPSSPESSVSSSGLSAMYSRLLTLADRRVHAVSVVSLTFVTPFGRIEAQHAITGEPSDVPRATELMAEAINERLKPLNSSLFVDLNTFSIPTREALVSRASAFSSSLLRRTLASIHRSEFTLAYIRRKDLNAATAYLDNMLSIDPTAMSTNAGYILARAGRTAEAERAFKLGIEQRDDPAVAAYDLGVLYAKQGELIQSLGAFDQVEALYREVRSNVGVLEILVDEHSLVEWEEDFRPDILAEADRAKSAIKRALEPPPLA